MATKFTPRMNAARAQMDGLRSTDPVVQAMLDATRRKREEEEKKRKEAAQAVSSSGSVGLNRAAAALPGAARLTSTDPVIQQLLGNKAKHDATLAAWDAQRGGRQEAYKKELQAAGGYYATLPQKSDWTAYSAAREDVYDPTYRYINGTEEFRDKAKWTQQGYTSERERLRYMTPEEIGTYNYLYNKNIGNPMGRNAGSDYLESLTRQLNERQAKAREAREREFSKEHEILGSIGSVVDSTLGGVASAVDLGLQGAKKLFTGEDIDYNTKYQQYGRSAENARDEVAKNIDNPVWKFLYQTGMSAADSFAAGMFGPLAGGWMLGTSAGASAARDAHERGASDGQALLTGVLAGTAEMLFERVSIGNLKGLKEVPVTGIKSIAKNVAKSMAVNASEELLTEIANTVTDLLVMGDMSNYALSVQDYVEQGMSEQEARNKAALDVAGQILLSGLAGGVMGTAFGGIGSVQSAFQNSRTGKAIAQTGNQQTVLDAGMGMAEGSDARKFAEKLKAKQEAGQTLRNSEIGALDRENLMQVKNALDTVTRLGKAFGRQVHFYEDADAEQGGYAENGEIYLNTRAPQQMMAQFFTHELTHTAENTEAYNLLAADIRGRLGKSLEEMKKKKIERYAEKDTFLTDAGAEAEVIADYVAKNLFTNEAEIKQLAKRNRNAALRVLDRIREWSAKVNGDTEKEFLLRAQRLYEKAIRETRGTAEGEKQYVIKKTQDNKNFVEIEDDILANVPQSEWVRTVKRNLGQRFPEGISVNGQHIKINWQTKKEMTGSDYTNQLSDNDNQMYADKMRATNNADEILETAQNWVGEKPKHKRKDNIREFARGEVLFRIGGRGYVAEVDVATTSNGSAALYDIVNIKTADIKEKNPTRTEQTPVSQVLGSDRSDAAVMPRRNEARHRASESAFNDSIPQTDANGNTSGENVTQLQQSKRQMAFTDESDELFAKPVYSKPPLSKEDLEARYEAEKAYNREARESTLFSQAEESDDAEDLSDRDAVLEEFWAETHQEGPEDIEASREEYEQFWRDFQARSDELAAEMGIKTGMEDLAAFLASEREITEEANIAREERARGKVAFSEGAAESDANAFTRDMLNGRGKDGFDRAQKNAAYAMGKAVGKITWADSTVFDEAAARLTEQYLRSGKYAADGSAALKRSEDAFDALWYAAEAANREYYEKYSKIRDGLSAYLRFDSEDTALLYRDHWQKKYGDLLKFSEDGRGIGEAYDILREQAPELFPERFTKPREQLRRMLQIAQSFEILRSQDTKKSDAIGYDIARERAKVEFKTAVQEAIMATERVRRYAEDKKSAKEEVAAIPTDPADILEIAEKKKKLQREADRIAARWLLTRDDKAMVDRLLRGEMKPSEVSGPNREGIITVFEKKAQVEMMDQPLRRYYARKKEQRNEAADTALGDINDLTKIRDKSSGLAYSTNTMERNIEDVFWDKRTQDAVKSYIDRVHVSEADLTRAKNAYNERVNKLELSQKVAKGNTVSEAAAVQILGEARDNIARLTEMAANRRRNGEVDGEERLNGKTLDEWNQVVITLKQENPSMDWAKIDGAVQVFHEIYDDLFSQMNRARVENGYAPIDYRRGYFPHFQKNEPDTIFGKLLAGLGVDAEVTPLPTSINGLTDQFKPGIAWFGHAQSRLGFETDFDAIEGYKRYIDGALRVIYHTDNIQNLRALERRIRYWTTDEGMRERLEQKWAELDANETMNEDEKNEAMQKLYAEGKFLLSNFCNELTEYTNLLAGKKSRLDRGMEALIGRRAYNILNALNRRLGANMVAANIGSAMTNIIPLQQGYAQMGGVNLAKGIYKTWRGSAKKDGFAAQSDFLTNRRGAVEVGSTFADKASRVAGWMMETVDGMVSETLVRARYEQNIKAGMSHEAALGEADRWTARVMADRSRGSMPTIFHSANPVVKMFTQFQLEVANNIAYTFKDMPRDAKEKGIGELVKVFMRYFIGAWLFNECYEFFFGRRPAFDPLGWGNEFVGDAFGFEMPNLLELGGEIVTGEANWDDFKTDKKGIVKATGGLFGNIAEDTPFIGGILPMLWGSEGGGRIPLSSAIPNITNISGIFDKDRAWQDRVEIGYKELTKPLYYLAMPMAGGQLKKTFEGITAAIQGGSYSYNTQGEKTLQYPLHKDSAWDTAKTYAQAAVLGKSSFGTSRDWVNSEFDSMSAKETAIYRGLMDAGMTSRGAFDLIRKIGAAKATEEMTADAIKRQILRDAQISEEERAVVYYGMMATEKERTLLDAFNDQNLNTARAADLLLQMRDASSTAEKRKMLYNTRLGDLEKAMIYREKISTAWDEEIAAVHEAGLMFDDFLAAQNALAEIEASVNGAEAEEDAPEVDIFAQTSQLFTTGWLDKQKQGEKESQAEKKAKQDKKTARDNAFIRWTKENGYSMQNQWVLMDCLGISTEAKKENKSKQFGFSLPTMPEIKLPEIKMPTLPTINLPNFGG